MSDDIIQELETELGHEKIKLFFQKYWLFVTILSALALLAVGSYQYYVTHTRTIEKKAASDYHALLEYYNDIENLINTDSPPPKLSDETVKNVPNYKIMARLVAYNAAQEQDASDAELSKILDVDTLPKGHKTLHDSLIRLYNLSLNTKKKPLEAIEKDFLTYTKHPFAFKSLAYEMLFMRAIEEKNAEKSLHYLNLVKEHAEPSEQNKIKVYAAHPLLIAHQKSLSSSSYKKESK